MSDVSNDQQTAPVYLFTNNWFDKSKAVWNQLLPEMNPSRVLEIGSYEGASACFLIDKIGAQRPLEIHCVDTWDGGIEHKSSNTDMNSVESRFFHNTRLSVASSQNKIDLRIHKGFSDIELCKLLANGKEGYFDFIYVDGSHQAPDVLCDAVLAFRLLKVGGHLIFDDYLWHESLPYGQDPIRCPKPAIDAFTNIYCRKIWILQMPLYQLYIKKTSN
jgi:predicted O-methyltransferase YrrM